MRISAPSQAQDTRLMRRLPCYADGSLVVILFGGPRDDDQYEYRQYYKAFSAALYTLEALRSYNGHEVMYQP